MSIEHGGGFYASIDVVDTVLPKYIAHEMSKVKQPNKPITSKEMFSCIDRGLCQFIKDVDWYGLRGEKKKEREALLEKLYPKEGKCRNDVGQIQI